MPWATHEYGRQPYYQALFTAASATTVTGLTSVDTATTWTYAGQVVILAAIQIGGLGIITVAVLFTYAVSHRLNVRSKVLAMGAAGAGQISDVGRLLRTIVVTTLSIEAVLAALLFPHFLSRGLGLIDSLWKSIFYSVSSFNNAGFTIDVGGLGIYQNDPWILTIICAGVFIGSLGFPVFLIIQLRGFSWKKWNLHTKLTISATIFLLLFGALLFFLADANNDKMYGDMSAWQRILHSLFYSVNTRSGGFNLVDTQNMNESSVLVSDVLMFIGGGSASTSGGIKVTTFAILCLAVVAEARGDDDMQAFGRRIPVTVLRQAVSVTFLGTILVGVSAALISHIGNIDISRALFEATSAFGTCGLSLGVTQELPPHGLYILTALMFAGRVGTITVASALAIRSKKQLYRNPEERPVIG
ncbi:MAG: potassium transporter TrkG [Micrococcaceae bacterium]